MEYTDLENYAARMVDLNGDDHGLKPHRLKAEQGKVHMAIMKILGPSVNRMTTRKKMNPKLRDEVDQHTSMAVIKALTTWKPELGKFSTYVHWQIKAELQTLQWMEYPERRRLMLAQPLKITEIDRPVRSGGDDGKMTFADTVGDEEAVDRVERGADEYIAYRKFERVMSHYVMKKLQACEGDKKDKDTIETQRAMIMRNHYVYVQRVVLLRDSEEVANKEGLTRERIRQIIKKIDDDLKGQLPRICAEDRHTIIPATRAAPADIHPGWDDVLASFLADSGKDARVLNRPAEDDMKEDKDTQIVTVVTSDDARIVKTPPIAPVETDNVIRLMMPTRVSRLMTAMGTTAAMAGGGMLMASAANAQSRALPPDSILASPAQLPIVQRGLSVAKPAAAPIGVKKHRARVAGDARSASAALPDIAMVHIDRPAWAAALGRYASLNELKTVQAKTKPWEWTAGLRTGYVHQADRYRIAYGPVSKEQAEGLCYEAKRTQRECNVVSYGAKTSPGAPA